MTRQPETNDRPREQHERIRVLIADDHAVLREGLRLLLEQEPDIEVVGEAATGEEAVALAQSLMPDVAIIDITMPVMNGIQATRRIRATAPDVKVLVLTMHGGAEYFDDMVAAGASGYVHKDSAAEQLVRAVRSVAMGALMFSPADAAALFGHLGGHGAERRPRLTPREEEILRLAAEGLRNAEIARRLGISVKTVETHRSHIMEKLDLHDRVDLVRYAVQHGLCDT